MNTDEVCNAIYEAVGSHVGDEKNLLEELLAISEGWKMRLEELEADEE